MYCIGNCYCWALIFKLIYGGEIFSVKQEFGQKAKNVRHYLLKKPNGRIVHFKRTVNILPPPLSAFFFIGKIESREKKKRRQ